MILNNSSGQLITISWPLWLCGSYDYRIKATFIQTA